MLRVVCVVAALVPSLAAQGFTPDMLSPPQVSHAAGKDQIHAVDMNGDGRPDLVTEAFTGDRGRIVLQLPDGSFGAATDVFFGGAQLIPPPQVADFNADGIPDLATLNVYPGDGVCVRLGNGDGTFGATQVTLLPGPDFGPQSYADFTGDGLVDLLTFVKVPGSTLIVGAKGLGDGTFGGFGALGHCRSPIQLEAGDVDGDGDVDAALLEAQPVSPGSLNFFPGVIALRNPGDGALAQVGPSIPVPGTRISQFGDLGADGLLDLLMWKTSFPHGLCALLGQPDASLVLVDLEGAPKPGADGDAMPVDLDLDGYLDVAVAMGTGQLKLQRFERLLPAGDDALVQSGYVLTEGLAAADFDGDGLQDLVILAAKPKEAPRDVLVFHNELGPFIDVGLGSPGGPTLAVEGQPSGGQDVTVSLQPAGSPMAGVLLVGVHSLLADSPAGLIVVDPLVLVPLALPASLQAHWPAGLFGTPVTLQGVALGHPPHAGNAVVIVPEP